MYWNKTFITNHGDNLSLITTYDVLKLDIFACPTISFIGLITTYDVLKYDVIVIFSI